MNYGYLQSAPLKAKRVPLLFRKSRDFYNSKRQRNGFMYRIFQQRVKNIVTKSHILSFRFRGTLMSYWLVSCQ